MVKEVEDLKGYLKNSCKGAYWLCMYGDVSTYILYMMTILCGERFEAIDFGINIQNQNPMGKEKNFQLIQGYIVCIMHFEKIQIL